MAALRQLAGWWGVLGTVAVLADAVWRLAPKAVEPWLDGPVQGLPLVAYVVSVLALAVGEGWMGFHRAFSPRVVGRAAWLAGPGPDALGAGHAARLRLLAPLVCMSLMHATGRRLRINWSLTAFIVAMIIALRITPQPWRGAVDAGVVCGLTIGALSIAWHGIRHLRGRPVDVPLELPEGA